MGLFLCSDFFKNKYSDPYFEYLSAISYNSISLETITKRLVVFEEVIFFTFLTLWYFCIDI